MEYRIKVVKIYDDTLYFPQYKSKFFGWCYFFCKNCVFKKVEFYSEDGARRYIECKIEDKKEATITYIKIP